jgi:hypothetical protein
MAGPAPLELASPRIHGVVGLRGGTRFARGDVGFPAAHRGRGNHCPPSRTVSRSDLPTHCVSLLGSLVEKTTYLQLLGSYEKEIFRPPGKKEIAAIDNYLDVTASPRDRGSPLAVAGMPAAAA